MPGAKRLDGSSIAPPATRSWLSDDHRSLMGQPTAWTLPTAGSSGRRPAHPLHGEAGHPAPCTRSFRARIWTTRICGGARFAGFGFGCARICWGHLRSSSLRLETGVPPLPSSRLGRAGRGRPSAARQPPAARQPIRAGVDQGPSSPVGARPARPAVSSPPSRQQPARPAGARSARSGGADSRCVGGPVKPT